MEGQTNNIGNQFNTEVPAKINNMTKVGEFLNQKMDWQLTEKQKQAIKAVSDFWGQEITDEQANEFLFQKMKI